MCTGRLTQWLHGKAKAGLAIDLQAAFCKYIFSRRKGSSSVPHGLASGRRISSEGREKGTQRGQEDARAFLTTYRQSALPHANANRDSGHICHDRPMRCEIQAAGDVHLSNLFPV